jgi:uncharacterized protein YaeQ
LSTASTVYNFDISLSDVDRGVYETLAIRVARHPSEAMEYLLTRVLAYCLEYTDGIAFSRGLAEPDEPALWVRDLTGQVMSWIEIGAPDADRLHRASKAAARVVIYTHKDVAQLRRQWAGKRIHRAESIELYAVDRGLLAELAELVDRRTTMELSVTERHLYVTVGGRTVEGSVETHAVTA